MTITLKSEQEKFIQEKLKTGKYKTVDAVIIEAFRLLEQRDKHYEKWLEETRKKVAVGLEQLNRGEGIEGEIVINRFKEKLRAFPNIGRSYGEIEPSLRGVPLKGSLFITTATGEPFP